MRRVKNVESTGKVTVTQSEERYPYASEILMNHGFCIIFLNMALGLLPVTIWGTRMKYFKCSISQFYTTLFCLCFIILSVIFVPIVFFPKGDEPNTMTNLVILVLMGMLHTVGYICLLIRGHFVARKIPTLWSQLSKLLQIAVLDMYGTNCYLLKEARSFAIWSVWEYSGIMVTGVGSVVVFSFDYTDGIKESISYYKLDFFIWPQENPLESEGMRVTGVFQNIQWLSYNMGYFIWQLCSSCHVLVTMLLCYIVIILTVCLKSVNQQIVEFKEQVAWRQTHGLSSSTTSFGVPRVHFVNRMGGSGRGISSWEYDGIIERLDNVAKVILIVEEITQTVSVMWGMSLIVEALILIAAGTVNAYNFLAMFRKREESTEMMAGKEDGIVKFSLPRVDEWIGIFVTVTTHFYFLFKLSSTVNRMIDEEKKSLHLLKQVSCQHLPQIIREKVHALKQDLASTSITISATNFFQVNKFLITSITSQIATYVIVLLQFAQQEINSGKAESDADKE